MSQAHEECVLRTAKDVPAGARANIRPTWLNHGTQGTYSPEKHLLSTCCVPGTALGTKNTSVSSQSGPQGPPLAEPRDAAAPCVAEAKRASGETEQDRARSAPHGPQLQMRIRVSGLRRFCLRDPSRASLLQENSPTPPIPHRLAPPCRTAALTRGHAHSASKEDHM